MSSINRLTNDVNEELVSSSQQHNEYYNYFLNPSTLNSNSKQANSPNSDPLAVVTSTTNVTSSDQDEYFKNPFNFESHEENVNSTSNDKLNNSSLSHSSLSLLSSSSLLLSTPSSSSSLSSYHQLPDSFFINNYYGSSFNSQNKTSDRFNENTSTQSSVSKASSTTQEGKTVNLDTSYATINKVQEVTQNKPNGSNHCEDRLNDESKHNQITQQEVVINDIPVLSRARASLPSSYLLIQPIDTNVKTKEPNFGVFSRKSIPHRTQFGPVEGVIKEFDPSKHNNQPNLIVFINHKLILDQSDENASNWMRFVRKSKEDEEHNLILVAKDSTMPSTLNEGQPITTTKFFFITTKPIISGEELKVRYSGEYIKRFKIEILQDGSAVPIPAQTFTKPLTSKTESSLSIAGGHKLRNKIAKSQQRQLLKEDKRAESERSKSDQRESLINSSPSNTSNILSTLYKHDNCQKAFYCLSDSKRHQMLHLSKKRYKCSLCTLSFNNLYHRNRHSFLNHRMSFYKYNSINRISLMSSKSSQSLTSCTHPQKLEQNETFIVTQERDDRSKLLDYLSFQKKRLPINESKKGQHNLNSFQCQQCYKSFLKEERLLQHILTHTQDDHDKPLVCQFCQKRFLNNSALYVHLKVHSFPKDQPRKYDCVVCKQWFDCHQARREHIATHADKISGLFTCPSCPKEFKDFAALSKHLRVFHSDKKYPCTDCDKVFSRSDKLKLHMLRHSDHREFLCQMCGKQFKRKDKLKDHIKRMHSEDKEAKLFAKKAALKSQQSTLSWDKKFIPKVASTDYHRFIYKCHTCLLGFKRRGMLVNHLAKRHPDTSPDTIPELNLPILKTTRDYYCLYCDKKYKSSSKRKTHILKNHPGKPLPMPNRKKDGIMQTQGLPNSNYSAAVGSITTHPHYCDWCHKQYASKAKLLQHQRKKHPEKLPIINLNAKSRSKVATQLIKQNTFVTTSPVTNALTNLTNLTSETSGVIPSVVEISSSSSNLISNSVVEINSLKPFTTQSSPSSSINSSNNTASNTETVPTTLIGTNLITIVGNIPNLSNIMVMPASSDINLNETSDFQELLQTAQPSNTSDLLTQAMSELTQTKDSMTTDEAATFLVPSSNNQITWF